MAMINQEEKDEIIRILEGGSYNHRFFSSRFQAAKTPSEEEFLRKQLRELDKETVESRREARKLVRKLQKLAGKKRAFTQGGYAQNWSEEQKRLDNLEHAAIYLSRANTNFHFFA